jgi:prolyl oligopeptidase
MKCIPLFVSVLSIFSAVPVLPAAESARFVYPPAPKSDQVDDYHGTKVADPYRDLENADSEATKNGSRPKTK